MSLPTDIDFYDIYQGDTGPVVKARPSVLDAEEVISGAWTCRLNVVDENGNVAIASRAVTDLTSDSLQWLAALTPAETATLSVDTIYYMVVEVANITLTPPFNREKRIGLKVYQQGNSA